MIMESRGGDDGVLVSYGGSGGGELDQHLVSSMLDVYDESKSVSETFDFVSGDDTSVTPNARRAPKRKKYHRHTPLQIQELEGFFKECPHPDEKQRLELSTRLNLETTQVKFWFQNRRTQMKMQIERHENMLLKKERDNLMLEQAAMRNALSYPMCTNCGGPMLVPEIPYEDQSLKAENARLKDELTRICLLVENFLGRPISSISNSIAQMSTSSSDFLQMDMSSMLHLAMSAMDELVKMITTNDPLWNRSSDGVNEVLNYSEYVATFPHLIGPKPDSFVFEASRDTGLVSINTLDLVEKLLDVDQWVQMFPSLVARAATTNVISSGIDGTRNGCLQLMQAELQVLSPLVPLRQVKFLRYSKRHEEGLWAVVDLSVDSIHETSTAFSPFSLCKRLPSGCIIQEMPDGYSKVTWIEHMQYDENVVHPLFHDLLRSGTGFGAKRWLASLQRQCESLASLASSTLVTDHNKSGISGSGQKSMIKLAQRMTDNFCSGICASVMSKWERIYHGNAGEESVQLMSRKSVNSPGKPSGIVLSATGSVKMPVSKQRLFDFLREKQYRSDWDILSNGGYIHEVTCIPKGHDPANCVRLLRCETGSTNQEMLILQETWTDPTSSLIVYAPVDAPDLQSVLSGGDSTYVALLPSGFAIYPEPDTPENTTSSEEGSSCLLTAGFQILVNELPTAKLTVESVTTVEHLIHCTIEKIHQALNCLADINCQN